MGKEKILQNSRKEDKNKDIAEMKVMERASRIAVKVGILVCCLISATEVALNGQINYACWMIYFSMIATIFLVKYIALRQKHEILLTIFFLICFVLMTVCYIWHLIGAV